MSKIELSQVNPESKEALELTKLLFEDLEFSRVKGTVEDFLKENSGLNIFIIGLTKKGESVASGALKHHDEDTVVIKRMYVVKEYRGEGLAKQILFELERLAKEMGYKRIVLQTGIQQPEAVNLYKQNKYKLIDCFGKHAGDPESVCFQKIIEENG